MRERESLVSVSDYRKMSESKRLNKYGMMLVSVLIRGSLMVLTIVSLIQSLSSHTVCTAFIFKSIKKKNVFYGMVYNWLGLPHIFFLRMSGTSNINLQQQKENTADKQQTVL